MELITDVIKKTVDVLVSLGLSKSTISNYETDFRLISNYRENNGKAHFSVAQIEKYISVAQERLSKKQISNKRYSEIRKAGSILKEMYNTGGIKWGRLCNCTSKKLSGNYEKLLNTYISAKTQVLCRKTIKTYSSIIQCFLFALNENGKTNLADVSCGDMSNMISLFSVSYTLSVESVLVALRSFFSFLLKNCLIDTDYMQVLAIRPANRRKVIKGFTSDEIFRIITAIDRNSAQGQRDYAIVILGLYTGLRGADIANLTFDNIDWECDKLQIIQSKTKNALELHLEPTVGNAIAEYVLHGRPSVESKHVFLATKPPYHRLNGIGSINNFLYAYMDKAGVSHLSGERKGFHSFRRSLATDLLEADVTLTFISEILGQVDPNSIRPYLSLNQKRLKDCALNLKDFEVTREGLI